MDILPLNWEETTEQVTNHHEDGEVISEQQAALDLLDLPVYTAGSIKAVDDRGAQMSIDKKEILKTVIAENFYAVHSKAQGRVPVPEELNLDAPFHLESLTDLLNVEIDNNLSLHALHFVPPVKGIHEPQDHGSSGGGGSSSSSKPFYDEPAINAPLASKGFGDPFESSQTSQSNSYAHNERGKDDHLFMLGGSSDNKQNNSIIPLSKILGDNFQEIPSGKKSKRSKSSSGSKSSSKKASTNINMVDLLPVGSEMLSEDEKDKKSGKKSSKKKKNQQEAGDEVIIVVVIVVY